MSQRLLSHSDDGLVVFCGAGVSMVAPTCLPSWWQMNEQVVLALSRQVEPFCSREKAADWARQINARRDNHRFPPEFQAEIIATHYGADYFKVLKCLDGDEPNAVHLLLASLASSGYVHAIVTSNFDRLIEAAFAKLGVPLDVHYQAGHFEALAASVAEAPLPRSRCQLLKLHGSVDDHRTLVDTLAQRMRGLSPAISSCLRYLLRKHYWLFLGYSGGDLQGNPQYLCLQAEAQHAVGFEWLVRESSKDEPNEAVVRICKLYGDRANLPRGELPAWLLSQCGPLLAERAPAPVAYGPEELERRKSAGARAIVDHTREWATGVGGVRAALILAEMLERSVSNPRAAQDLLRGALESNLQDARARVAVTNQLANMLAREGKLDEAAGLAESALTTADVDDCRAAILSTLGLIEQRRGDYSRALAEFEQAYESSDRSNDEVSKSIALHNRAMTLASLGRNDEALSCYREGLEISRKLGDAMAQAETLNNIGDLLRQLDLYDEAIDVLNQAIELRDRLGDDRGVAQCTGNIAGALNRQGKVLEAKAAYERVLAIFRRIGDRPDEVTTMLNLGTIAAEQRKHDEAERIYRQALAMADASGLQRQHASASGKLAALLRDTGRGTDAEPLFDEALAICRRIGDKTVEADVLNELGIHLWKAAHLDGARSTFERAIAIREMLKEEAALCEALGNLALVYADEGDPSKAMELMTRELAIAERLQARSLIASAYYNIGVLQYRRGAVEEALNSFEAAHRLYLATGRIDRAIEILTIMGEVSGRQGKISASLRWFDQAIAIAEGVDQRSQISHRLAEILKVLLENGYEELGQQYVRRLEAVGAKVEIRTA